MPLFRRRKPRAGTTSRAERNEAMSYLQEWASSRRGVEAFVEPRTAVTDTTVLLVAGTGEWTRRAVDSPQAAADLAKRLAIPVYDAGIVGYPQRMRDWNQRRSEN